MSTDTGKVPDQEKTTEASKDEKEPEPRIEFSCSVCQLIKVTCHYYGTRPPFARKLQLTEDSYVMKDPFCPPPTSGQPNPEYFLVVGVKCTICESPVCKSPECSFYYGKTFCSQCTLQNIKEFPLEIQTKIRKQLSKAAD